MNIPNSFYHRRQFPPEVLAHAVFAYHRFVLSLRESFLLPLKRQWREPTHA